MAYSKTYTRINWQNAPSEATALNETNLNKMDSAIDTIDDRVVAQDTQITNLDSGKVDKVAGKGLSTEDYTTSEKNKLSHISQYATNNDVTTFGNAGRIIAQIKKYKADDPTTVQSTMSIYNNVVVDSA